MCLSTVYKNKMEPESVAMKNVMTIECRDGYVILTDLMERQMAIEGELEKEPLLCAHDLEGIFREKKDRKGKGFRVKRTRKRGHPGRFLGKH